VPKFWKSLEPSTQSAGIVSRTAAAAREPQIQYFSHVFGRKVINFMIHSETKIKDTSTVATALVASL
jgi:hypothetical protein